MSELLPRIRYAARLFGDAETSTLSEMPSFRSILSSLFLVSPSVDLFLDDNVFVHIKFVRFFFFNLLRVNPHAFVDK